jgi:hypothetical protein
LRTAGTWPAIMSTATLATVAMAKVFNMGISFPPR